MLLYVTNLSSLEVGLSLLPDLPHLLVLLKFNIVCRVSPLTADHHTKSEVDAVPFSLIICHVFHTGYVPDTELTQIMCLVLILQPNKVGTVKPTFSEETEAWGHCLVGKRKKRFLRARLRLTPWFFWHYSIVLK